MENPDLVLQETGSRPTYSRLNYVPSGDTLRRDAISSFCFFRRPASRRPTWFPDSLGNSSYPIFTKFGMQVYWVNSLYGIAFGDDSSIAN